MDCCGITKMKRFAIIGSGPAGMYAAEALLRQQSLLQNQLVVHLFDRDPMPFGLVRTGVAPDHPEAKAVCELFRASMEKHRHCVKFFGNCDIGRTIPTSFFLARGRYDALLLAFGASKDRIVGMRGEDNVLPARRFVEWYNARPHRRQELDQETEMWRARLTGARTVGIIGNGNVALDCARILVKGAEALSHTDMSRQALSVLRNTVMERIVIVGRRGPVQAAFTTKELRELFAMENTSCLCDPDDLLAADTPASKDERRLDRAKARQWSLWEQVARNFHAPRREKTVAFAFLRTPLEYIQESRTLHTQRNILVGAAGQQRAEASPGAEFDDILCDVVLRSIGQEAEQLQFPGVSLPFDAQRSVMPNIRGRVDAQRSDGHAPPFYVAGWLKRGPTGIIGTNKYDAEETVETMLAETGGANLPSCGQDRVSEDEIERMLRDTLAPQGIQLMRWENVQRVLGEEARLGYKLEEEECLYQTAFPSCGSQEVK